MRFLSRGIRALFTIFVTYVLVVSAILAVLFFFPEVWSPPATRFLENWLSQRSGLQVKINRLRFVGLWPVTWRLDETSFTRSTPGLKGAAKAFEIGFKTSVPNGQWLHPKLELEVTAHSPSLTYVMAPSEPTGAGQPEPVDSTNSALALPHLPVPLDTTLRFNMRDGTMNVQKVTGEPLLQIEKADIAFSLPLQKQYPWRPALQLNAFVTSSLVPALKRIPLVVNMAHSEVDPEAVKLSEAEIKISGFTFLGGGEMRLKDRRDVFKFKLQPTDLNQVPLSFLPPGQWQGHFQGDLEMTRAKGPWQVKGELASQNVRGQTHYAVGDFALDGNVGLESRLRFVYNKSLFLDDATLNLDLTNAHVGYGTFFLKPSGTEGLVNLVADSRDQGFELRRALFRVGPLRLELTGHADLGPQAAWQAQAHLPSTELAGLEKNFPPLKSSPLTGSLRAEARLEGSWLRLNDFKVHMSELELNQVAGEIHWRGKSPNQEINGPFLFNLKASGEFRPSSIESANLRGWSDLRGVTARWGEGIKKPKGWPLRLVYALNWSGNRLSVSDFSLLSPAGKVKVAGLVELAKNSYSTNLRLNLDKCNLAHWHQWLVGSPLILAGWASGDLKLTGRYLTDEGMANSPLVVKGQLALMDGRLEYRPLVESGPTAPPPQESPLAAEEKPWLPAWSIIRNSVVGLRAQLQKFQYGDFLAQGLKMDGQMASGHWQGQMQIQNLWQGQVSVSKWMFSPTQAPPTLELKTQWQGVEVGSVLNWLRPQLKGFMNGRSEGRVSLIGSLPSQRSWLKELKVEGETKVSGGRFNTFHLTEEINGLLEKIHLKRGDGVRAGPVQFELNSQYLLEDGLIHLQRMRLLTPERDELQMQGLVRQDLNVDLAGSAYLASVKVQGSIAMANRDQTGRFVLPLQIRGPLFKPGFSMAEASLKAMAARTLENEVGKAKENLETNVKKRLKGLFGQ